MLRLTNNELYDKFLVDYGFLELQSAFFFATKQLLS